MSSASEFSTTTLSDDTELLNVNWPDELLFGHKDLVFASVIPIKSLTMRGGKISLVPFPLSDVPHVTYPVDNMLDRLIASELPFVVMLHELPDGWCEQYMEVSASDVEGHYLLVIGEHDAGEIKGYFEDMQTQIEVLRGAFTRLGVD